MASLETISEFAFFETLRAENFDIAINFQAEETFSWAIIRELRARCTVGQTISNKPVYDRSISFSYYQHEILRHLHLVELVGVKKLILQHTLYLFSEERTEADRLIFQQGILRPFIIIHAGATDIRRRWPTSKFAELADLLMEDGYAILLTGSEQEFFVIEEIT
ncbi:glycosyltransferase family 9 protein [Sphingobacterium chuzhouense]|uniref:Glycosyltransferase family 9 protein n=1 Tax=Sphingobacterium chuzhouense TaxID=1742264 RepID=A0ABR7XQP7_9SPHI|nr:glycosyltransferase family 9 protein [Sphingobacterium chuzhouense]